MPSTNPPSKTSASRTKDKSTTNVKTTTSPIPGSFIRPLIVLVSLYAAVWIRLQAVRTYGKVIHEFDPWFNYRATKYLVDNGWQKFSNWYDYESWYPLGRPVGHTIYPGLMVAAAKIYEYLPSFGYNNVSLNDVCVYIPAGFAIITILATYGLTYEVTNGSWTASTIACYVMAIIPAHLMRSVAGGYDNESVAVAAIVVTFYLWVRSLRSVYLSWFYGSLCGLTYVYLVSSWGAYIFVLNMIGVHVGILSILMNRFSFRLYLSYSCFYVIGTYGALQFPTVGLQPLQSMEQMGPLLVFGILQIFAISEIYSNVTQAAMNKRFWSRWILLISVGLVLAILIPMYLPANFLGPLSARVRGLFVRHTKTGNPLVDSVAEHQQTPSRVYWLYFHWTFYLTPIGFFITYSNIREKMKSEKLENSLLGSWSVNNTNSHYIDQAIFLLAFIAISYFFSSRMIRLVLLFSPATSIATGIVLEKCFHWSVHRIYQDEEQIYRALKERRTQTAEKEMERRTVITQQLTNYLKEKAKKFKDKKASIVPTKTQIDLEVRSQRQKEDDAKGALVLLTKEWNDTPHVQKYAAYGFLVLSWFATVSFTQHSIAMSHHLSEPQIMVRIREDQGGVDGSGSGTQLKIVDDFREAYWWLRDNTPKDSRIMAWWDYGYQINGIAERTTLADGNTWNHEHIALLGRALVSNEEIAWETTRHLADYVLCWSTRHSGSMGDDLAKMPHMARIAGSVYDDVNASDYYLINREGDLSNGIKQSMLYQVHSYGLDPDVPEPKHFEEAYTTEHQMVRIFKVKDIDEESKKWIKEHHTYPPALDHILKMKQDFRL